MKYIKSLLSLFYCVFSFSNPGKPELCSANFHLTSALEVRRWSYGACPLVPTYLPRAGSLNVFESLLTLLFARRLIKHVLTQTS